MFDFLRKLWNGPTVSTASCPVFGQMALVEIRGSQWWECEMDVQGIPIPVSIHTCDGAPPSEAQVAFFHRTLCGIDAVFERVRPALEATYAEIHGPLPQDWRRALALCGLDIPIDGNDQNPWSVSFESTDDRKGLYTCSIQNGMPGHVQFDS